MMKLIAGVMVLTLATAAHATMKGGGGPGDGNYDCSRCWITYYPGFGNRSFYQCYGTEAGDGAGCEATATGCTFTGGCVSLPGRGTIGVIP